MPYSRRFDWPGCAVPMSARSPDDGRFRIYWRQRGTIFGSQRPGALPSPDGRAVCHSVVLGPSQFAFAPAESPVRTRRKSPAVRPSRDRLAWSGPALLSGKRNLRQGVPVPEGLPAGPSPTGPSDPVGIPALRRSLGGVQLPAVSHAPLASPHQNQSRGLARRSPNLAGRHTPAWSGSVWAVSADRWWTHGRRGPLGTFSGVFVSGRKRRRILPLEKPVLWAFQKVPPP